MENNADQVRQKEPEIKHPEVVVASSTFYKNWYPGERKSNQDIDKVRGDLALESLSKTVGSGYRVIDIDGGSSEEFRQALIDRGVQVVDEVEHGYSGSRRQGIREAQKYGPKAIFTVEPEKPSLMDSVADLARPILEGKADIVFAERDQAAFDKYPPVQAEFEQKSNSLANKVLKDRGLLPPDSKGLDWWMGPRMIRNVPGVVELFMKDYKFSHVPPITPKDDTHKKELAIIFNPDLWSNALYIPVVIALAKRYEVESVPVSYKHSEIQTQSEVGSQEFDRKRAMQYEGIIFAMVEAVRLAEQETGKSLRQTRLTT